MDRGTEAMQNRLDGVAKLRIRHDRRGWLQECLCCVMKSDFKYYNGDNDKLLAESTEETTFCCRCCCAPHHSWEMTVTEKNTGAEMIEVDRPFRCCMAPCKCCCLQEATITSGDEDLGEIREAWWWFVPSYKVYDNDDDSAYIIHPPTCCCGTCINCFTEGNICTYGCCKIPFRIYPADQARTNGDAPYVGKILKIPKNSLSEVFGEDNNWELIFPEEATKDQKGLLLGSALLINSYFFEGSE